MSVEVGIVWDDWKRLSRFWVDRIVSVKVDYAENGVSGEMLIINYDRIHVVINWDNIIDTSYDALGRFK